MSNAPENSVKPTLRIQTTTGIILAGGKSTRYGRNKAFAEIHGTPLIERVITIMGSVFDHLLLVTNTPDEYAHLGLPMVQDLIKGLGPLGGIYTGLASTSDDAGFCVACDMPFLNAQLVRAMVNLWEDCDVVAPRVDWMIEPLHALYSKSCLKHMKEHIDSGGHQIVDFFSRVRVRYLEEKFLRTFDPDLKCFLNVNRPEDLTTERCLA